MKELIRALDDLQEEKHIEKEVIIQAIEDSLVAACNRDYGKNAVVKVNMDRETAAITVYLEKTVVEDVVDDSYEISLEDAKMRDPGYELGDIVQFEVRPKNFGRIAAQHARSVIVQKIKEEERRVLYEHFQHKEKDLVTGVVQRFNGKNICVSLDDKTDAVLTEREQVKGEVFHPTDRIKLYVVEVKDTNKGPRILVSRTHRDLVKRLFEKEVSEVYEGIVEIRSISREPGSRTKIAVSSNDPNVDPVGACVGKNGIRVDAIVNDLQGEKIDIIAWNDDPALLIKNALSPSNVISVRVNRGEKSAKVVVPDYQLSLAIGKEGQNARLAARLTGYKIDIKSESQAKAQMDDFEYNVFTTIDDFEPEQPEEEVAAVAAETDSKVAATEADDQLPKTEETGKITPDQAEADKEADLYETEAEPEGQAGDETADQYEEDIPTESDGYDHDKYEGQYEEDYRDSDGYVDDYPEADDYSDEEYADDYRDSKRYSDGEYADDYRDSDGYSDGEYADDYDGEYEDDYRDSERYSDEEYADDYRDSDGYVDDYPEADGYSDEEYADDYRDSKRYSDDEYADDYRDSDGYSDGEYADDYDREYEDDYRDSERYADEEYVDDYRNSDDYVDDYPEADGYSDEEYADDYRDSKRYSDGEYADDYRDSDGYSDGEYADDYDGEYEDGYRDSDGYSDKKYADDYDGKYEDDYADSDGYPEEYDEEYDREYDDYDDDSYDDTNR